MKSEFELREVLDVTQVLREESGEASLFTYQEQVQRHSAGETADREMLQEHRMTGSCALPWQVLQRYFDILFTHFKYQTTTIFTIILLYWRVP